MAIGRNPRRAKIVRLREQRFELGAADGDKAGFSVQTTFPAMIKSLAIKFTSTIAL